MPSRSSSPSRTASRDAAAAIRAIAARLMQALGLRDVFSMDFRVEADDTVHLIEFEVCPGLPCFDFRAYCRLAMGAQPRRGDGRNGGEPVFRPAR